MKYLVWLLMLPGLWMTGVAGAETLSLEGCLQLAREHNPDLVRAALRPRQAEAEIGKARSGYLPHLDLEGGYTVQQEAQAVSILGRTVPMQDANYAHAGLQAYQTLYDFGRTGGRLERARAGYEAAREDYLALGQDIFLRTVVAYYRLLEGQRLLQAADQEVVQMEEHLARARALYEQGVVTRNDVLQAEVQLASSRQLSLRRRNDVDNGWLELNYLTGREARPGDQLEEAGGLMAEPVPKTVAERPDLGAARQRVVAATAAVRQSRAEFFPELFVRGGIDYLENSHYEEQAIYGATLGLKVNLFNGRATEAAHRKALAALAEERRALEALTRQAELEYRRASNDTKVAKERIAVTGEAILQGEENLRINQQRYQEHVGTATDVIDAQTLLTRARTEYFQALFEYGVALARLRKATGSL
jgi:outer membrane protein TolC